MLSPKMQRTVRVNESQIIMLSEKAHYDHSMTGYLYKRAADSGKWQQRWFVLYQNILFYYENEGSTRPSGVIMLEGCYCDRLITAKGKDADKQICFSISYRRENQRQYELKATTERDCKMWIDAIREASFNKLLLQKEELEQKHLHLLQIVESEKTAKWQYTQQCEELTSEIKKLRAELCALKKELRPRMASAYTGAFMTPIQYALSQTTGLSCSAGSIAVGSNAGTQNVSTFSDSNTSGAHDIPEGNTEIQKIKKVQSFFRGWLCRRRWKQIVEQYIKSPHAESMRKRNSLVFQMVEAEEEYTEQMEILVSCFLRPLKMAASSKKPPCSHEDVNSIFLNSETVLFLHQIFLKGLTSRMESWPTLVLGDLFDMLLPMLSIYQEYVRNHHYSLQVLTECKQSSPLFAMLLARLENKTACHGRSLETFLTYPMHQVPRYIITLHELLAHTPHDHVERKSLQNARQQLEDLSRQMHDEVSETENLRKNLAVERMIVEGCDILLDVNQVFVRQGALIQILYKPRGARSRLSATFGGKSGDKESLRQCFLFSNHLILTTRQSDDGGRLNLVQHIGKIPLCDAVLVEDPSEQNVADDDAVSVCSYSSGISESSSSANAAAATIIAQYHGRDFKIIFDLKNSGDNRRVTIHLVAPTMQEKAAWISDISQCMDNVHFNELLHGSTSDASSVTMPQSIRNDPKLFKDDVDIRFSRTLNSCKVPQIRYATPDRLLQRLTDLRFLSIDFLNTFLLTYRVFTDAVTVLEALKKVFYDTEPPDAQIPGGSLVSLDVSGLNATDNQQYSDDRRRSSSSPRRTSGASSVSGYGSEVSDGRETGSSTTYEPSPGTCFLTTKTTRRTSYKKHDEQALGFISEAPTIVNRSPSSQSNNPASNGQSPVTPRRVNIKMCAHNSSDDDGCHLTIPKVIAVSSSAETLTDATIMSAPSSPSNLSSVTLIGSTGSGSASGSEKSPQDVGETSQNLSMDSEQFHEASNYETPSSSSSFAAIELSSTFSPLLRRVAKEDKRNAQSTSEKASSSGYRAAEIATPPRMSPIRTPRTRRLGSDRDEASWTDDETVPLIDPRSSPQRYNNNNDYHQIDHRASIVSAPPATMRSSSISTIIGNYWASRRSIQDCEMNLSGQHGTHQEQSSSKAGVVITSFRQSHR
ncbi:hypothetical protein QAD02_000815, partial [Eretmocerus hayati]